MYVEGGGVDTSAHPTPIFRAGRLSLYFASLNNHIPPVLREQLYLAPIFPLLTLCSWNGSLVTALTDIFSCSL